MRNLNSPKLWWIFIKCLKAHSFRLPRQCCCTNPVVSMRKTRYIQLLYFCIIISLAFVVSALRCNSSFDIVSGHFPVISVCLCIVVSNAYCVVLLFCFFVLCTQCCQFLWIVHFWWPLRYSLTFICFVCLRLVYPMLPVSLDCPFLMALSVFSNVYLMFV